MPQMLHLRNVVLEGAELRDECGENTNEQGPALCGVAVRVVENVVNQVKQHAHTGRVDTNRQSRVMNIARKHIDNP